MYATVQGAHKALADFVEGSDVSFPKSTTKISAAALRRPPEHNIQEPLLTDPVLHRLLLSTVGKPLWEASSELHLLKALKDALLGTFHGQFKSR